MLRDSWRKLPGAASLHGSTSFKGNIQKHFPSGLESSKKHSTAGTSGLGRVTNHSQLQSQRSEETEETEESHDMSRKYPRALLWW